MMTSNIVENNLTEFKKYLDNPDSEIQQYLGENGVVYTYDVDFGVYSYDSEGTLINSDTDTDNISSFGASDSQSSSGNGQGFLSAAFGGTASAGAENFFRTDDWWRKWHCQQCCHGQL